VDYQASSDMNQTALPDYQHSLEVDLLANPLGGEVEHRSASRDIEIKYKDLKKKGCYSLVSSAYLSPSPTSYYERSTYLKLELSLT